MQFSAVYDLNSIKVGASVTATLSKEFDIVLSNQVWTWEALKTSKTDH